MDIDFLSTNTGGVGGISLAHIFMAKISTSFHSFSLILFLFLTINFPNSSKGRLLMHCNNSCMLLQQSSSYKIRQNETSTGFKKRASHHHTSVAATRKSFRAAAHEVPSGPNPESNWLYVQVCIDFLAYILRRLRVLRKLLIYQVLLVN